MTLTCHGPEDLGLASDRRRDELILGPIRGERRKHHAGGAVYEVQVDSKTWNRFLKRTSCEATWQLGWNLDEALKGYSRSSLNFPNAVQNFCGAAPTGADAVLSRTYVLLDEDEDSHIDSSLTVELFRFQYHESRNILASFSTSKTISNKHEHGLTLEICHICLFGRGVSLESRISIRGTRGGIMQPVSNFPQRCATVVTPAGGNEVHQSAHPSTTSTKACGRMWVAVPQLR